MIEYIKLLFCTLLVLVAIGCSSEPPVGWGSVKIPSVMIEENTSSSFVNASSQDWTDSLVYYDNKYQYNVKVAPSNPSYSIGAYQYKALALGTAEFCNNYGNLGGSCSYSYSSGVSYVTFPEKITNSKYVVMVPNSNCKINFSSMTTFTIDSKNSIFKNGISLIYLPSNRCTGTCAECCAITSTDYIVSGCSAINGSAINGSAADESQSSTRRTGVVEYKISDIKPGIDESGDLLKPDIFNAIQNASPGKIWFRIIDTDQDYKNNYGQYEIQIKYPEIHSNFISKLGKFLINPLVHQISKVSIQFWENIVGNTNFKRLVNVVVVLYIIFLGISFVLGNVQITQTDLIFKVVKIAIIYALISPYSYQFFNDNLFSLFIDGQKYLINVITNPTTSDEQVSSNLNYNSLFGFTNYVISSVFTTHFLTILVSLILWFPVGWVALIFLLAALYFYVIAIVEAIILYLIAFTAVAFMISMAPFFIILILFDQTKNFCVEWLNIIIAFTMQPIILFATIMVVTVLINGAIYNIISVSASWECLIPFFIKFDGFPKIPLFCIYWYKPQVFFVEYLRDILVFFLLVGLLKKIPMLANTIAESIFSGTAILNATASIAVSPVKSIKSAANFISTRRFADVSELHKAFSRKNIAKGVDVVVDKGLGGGPSISGIGDPKVLGGAIASAKILPRSSSTAASSGANTSVTKSSVQRQVSSGESSSSSSSSSTNTSSADDEE